MAISIDTCSLDRALEFLENGNDISGGKYILYSKKLSGDYTGEPGLRMLGAQHCRVINGETGSATHTLRQLRQLIRWLAEGTKAMRGAFVGQDDTSAAILCGLKSIQAEDFTFPTRPDGAFSPFDFPDPTHGGTDDPGALVAMLNAGNDSDIYALADYWHNLSSSLNDTVDALARARAQLEENTGEAIDAAAACCTQVMATAQSFADNATAMHASVSQLPHIRQAARTQIAAIEAEHAAAVAAATNPAGVRAAGEAARAATREFMAGPYQAMLTAAVPPLRNLTERPNVGQGGGHLTAHAPTPIHTSAAEVAPTSVMSAAHGTPAVGTTGTSVGGTTTSTGGGPAGGGVVGNPTTPPTSANTIPAAVPSQFRPPKETNGFPPPHTNPGASRHTHTPTPYGPSATNAVNQSPRAAAPHTPRTSYNNGHNNPTMTPRSQEPWNRNNANDYHKSMKPNSPASYLDKRPAGPYSESRARSVIVHPGPHDQSPIHGNDRNKLLHNDTTDRGNPYNDRNYAHNEHSTGRSNSSHPTGHDGSRPAMGRTGIAPMGGYGNASKNQKQEPEGKYKPITSEFEAEYNLRQLRGDIGLTTPHVIGAQLRENK